MNPLDDPAGDSQEPEVAADAGVARRGIRSFVLRQGRMSPAQHRAIETLLPRFGIPYCAQTVDFDAHFGRAAPRVLEIGFGMGDTTARIAEAQPAVDFIGIEVHAPGVGALLRQLGENNLTNVRVIQHDAVEVVRDMIAPNTLAGIHVFFPDPWPKKRHHKRRLLQPAFASLLASRLKEGGYLHVATDWVEYADHILDVLAHEPLLSNTGDDGFVPRPEYRPLTKFEQRGLRLGHSVRDLLFRRVTGNN